MSKYPHYPPIMDYYWFVLMLVLLLYSSTFCAVIHGRWMISDKEGMELEKQLKILNTSPVKTLQMLDRDIFYCTDIYKQPTMDHPSLKNHKIQMRPSTFPEGMVNELFVEDMMPNFSYAQTCPMGTVLIEQSHNKDLFEAKHLQKFVRRHFPNTFYSKNPRTHWATVNTKVDIFYHGAKASLGIYNFQDISVNQQTGGLIWIVGGFGGSLGPYEEINAIAAGWHISPKLYGDFRTRLFTMWTVDGYHETGCINMQCPGFVQTSPTFGPGKVLEPVSVYNGIQHAITLLIFKDRKTGNWWLYFERENFKDFLGYWPKELFNKLDNASEIIWGGYTHSPFNEPSPPMGSGHFPSEGPNKTCSFTQIEIVDENNLLKRLPPKYVWNFADLPKYYSIDAYHDSGDPDGFMFAYGGPGEYKI